MPHLPEDTVVLNGETYTITPTVIMQPVSDFAATLRLGNPTYDARQHASYVVFSSFGGGLGVINADVRESLERIADSNGADTTITRQYRLPPLKQALTFSASAGTGNMDWWRQKRNFHIVPHPTGGNIRLVMQLGNSLYHRLPPTSAVWTRSQAAVAANTGGTQYFSTFFNTNRFYYIDGTTIKSLPYDLSGAPVAMGEALSAPIAMIQFDKWLMVLDEGDGKLYYSVDGDTFVKDTGGVNKDFFMRVPGASFGDFVGVAEGPNRDPTLYYRSGHYLYILDIKARSSYPVELGFMNPLTDAVLWDDSIVLTDGKEILQYFPGSPGLTRSISPYKEQGLIQGRYGMMAKLHGVTGGNLYGLFQYATSNGTIDTTTGYEVWEYAGTGWHPKGKVRAGLGQGIFAWGQGQSSSLIFRPIVITCGDSSGHVSDAYEMPLTGKAPATDAGYKYDTGAVIITPWYDGGFAELTGALYQIWFNGYATGTETVKFEYQIDGDETTSPTTGWTTTATFTAKGQRYDFGADKQGVSFKTVRFRITLARGGTNTTSPNGLPFTLVFDKKPPLRRSFQFTIDQAQMAAGANTGANKFITIFNKLLTAWNSPTLVTLTVADISTRVKLVAMPMTIQEIRSAQERGKIQVQVIEPIERNA